MVGFLSIANDDAHPDFPVCLLQCIRAFFSVLAAPKCRERAQGPHQKASVSIESALPALLRLICSIRALEFFSLKNFPHLPCSILISSDMRRAVDCAENSAGRRRFERRGLAERRVGVCYLHSSSCVTQESCSPNRALPLGFALEVASASVSVGWDEYCGNWCDSASQSLFVSSPPFACCGEEAESWLCVFYAVSAAVHAHGVSIAPQTTP